MSPCTMPFWCFCASVCFLTTVVVCETMEKTVNNQKEHTLEEREKRQIFYQRYNFSNYLDGGNVLLGSASYSMEGAASYEDLYQLALLASLQNTNTTTTTTTQAPTTTTAGGRDLSASCTCISGRCVTYQEILDLCLSTLGSTERATCLANLDLLCENVKTQAAG